MEKIAYFSNTAFSLYNYRRELMRGMKERGFRVFAVAPFADKYFVKKIEEQGIDFINTPLKKGIDFLGGDILYFLKVFFLCKKEKFFLCHNFTIKPCIYATLAQRLAGVKKIYCTITGLGYSFEKKSILNKLVISLYRFSFKFVDKIFFQNPDDKNLFLELKILKEEKAKVIRSSGVDTNHFFKKEKIKKEKITISLISRMLWSKGIKEFKEAAGLLKEKYSNVDFLLIGPIDKENPSGIEKEEIEKWEGVTYLGERKDIKEILSLSDIVVLPSIFREGVPRVLLEAGSMGKPLITTNTPGCREVVKNNINGFLIESQNSRELARKIEILIKDKGLRERFGKRSREIIEKEFKVERVVKETIENYSI